MINSDELVPGNKYYVLSIRQTYPSRYIGIFEGNVRERYFVSMQPTITFSNVNIYRLSGSRHLTFYRDDLYYDPERIKTNAQTARQRMEKRALNIVLKRIVDENFEW